MKAVYIGCFDQAPNRIEGHLHRPQSWDDCAQEAASAGKRFFGLEFPEGAKTAGQSHCLLLESLPSTAKKKADSECAKEVFDGKNLGGANHLAVYDTAAGERVPPPSPPFC